MQTAMAPPYLPSSPEFHAYYAGQQVSQLQTPPNPSYHGHLLTAPMLCLIALGVNMVGGCLASWRSTLWPQISVFAAHIFFDKMEALMWSMLCII